MTNGKQRVREILFQDNDDWFDVHTLSDTEPDIECVHLTKEAIEQIVDSIEEIVKKIIGEQTIYNMAHEEGLNPHYVEGYNNMVEATRLMRAEQLIRWESK